MVSKNSLYFEIVIMAGHSNYKNARGRRDNDQNTTASNSANNNSNVEQQRIPPQLDIDELAKKEVTEVETLLNNSTNSISLETLDSSLSILKQIITAADLHRTNDKDDSPNGRQVRSQETEESIYADYSDDNEQFNAHVDLTEQFANNSVKWTIRVQAFKLVHRLIRMFVQPIVNVSRSIKPAVLKHLPDLVKLSFVAATSPYDELKVQGFEMFLYLIDTFAYVEEKEFPGHSILEQYKTQILSAIKPAFHADAPPYITAIASQICCLWICRGLEKDPTDVTRTFQLMLSSIEKLDGQCVNQNSKLYTESELEQERIDILGSWAQLYIASEELQSNLGVREFRLTQEECNKLSSMVDIQISRLVEKWWEALKDYALLIMTSPRMADVSLHDNSNVYTREVALRLFGPNWPKLVLATSVWLSKEIVINTSHESAKNSQRLPSNIERSSLENFAKFIYGIIMNELCRQQVAEKSNKLSNSTTYVVRALNLLISIDQLNVILLGDMQLAQEFYTILYNVTVSYCRDPQRILLSKTLDAMFDLIINKIKAKPKCLNYGLVRLIAQLMAFMKGTEIAIRHKSETVDLYEVRMQFAISLHNLFSLIKMDPKQAFVEPQLQEAIIIVFQELLRFDLEPNFVLASIEQINELYNIIPPENARYFIDSISKELYRRVSCTFKSLYTGESSESDKSQLSMWDSLVKSYRLAIVKTNKSNQSHLIDDYVLALVENIDCDEDLSASEKSKRKRDLLDVGLSQINILSKVLEVGDTGQTTSLQVRDKLSAVRKLQVETKAKLDLKTARMKSHEPSSRNPPTGHPPTRLTAKKITLKADFSNFYAKKT